MGDPIEVLAREYDAEKARLTGIIFDLVKALETVRLMIKGQMVECAVIDAETMEPLGGMLDRVLVDVGGVPK
jgi:hypothetical protein